MKYLLTLIGSFLLLVSCHKDEAPDFTKQRATRAVMIYMAGENNLTKSSSGTRYLQKDLQEMIEGSKLLTDHQRLFVFVDSLGTDSQQKGTPYIMEIHGGQVYSRYKYDSDFYSCDPDKFQEVIGWMTQHVEADGYGLVLWGHATGWIVDPDTIVSSRRAYGYDEGKDTGTKAVKWMNITQMAQALKALPKMDFIFADCCNMMCAEVGYELRNATEYLIGSPAEIPGNGAPYDLIVPQLFKNGSSLYRGIIDTYYDYYQQEYNTSGSYSDLKGYSVPLSVIDTKYVEQLAVQTRDILSTFAPEYPASVDVNAIPYYINIDSPLMYDMMGLVKKNAPSADYEVWERAYRQAVPYYRMSMKWMTSYSNLESAFKRFDQDAASYGCVSMFVPMEGGSYTYGSYKYNTTSKNFAWTRVMEWNRFGWE